MDPQVLISALTGGVAGAALTQVATIALAHWRRPQLRISFSVNEPGCVVDTPVVRSPRPGDGYVERGEQ
jgi:hypothetical protein